jgi:hypothetical protein
VPVRLPQLVLRRALLLGFVKLDAVASEVPFPKTDFLTKIDSVIDNTINLCENTINLCSQSLLTTLVLAYTGFASDHSANPRRLHLYGENMARKMEFGTGDHSELDVCIVRRYSCEYFCLRACVIVQPLQPGLTKTTCRIESHCLMNCKAFNVPLIVLTVETGADYYSFVQLRQHYDSIYVVLTTPRARTQTSMPPASQAHRPKWLQHTTGTNQSTQTNGPSPCMQPPRTRPSIHLHGVGGGGAMKGYWRRRITVTLTKNKFSN